jgi:hypothetical protein
MAPGKRASKPRKKTAKLSAIERAQKKKDKAARKAENATKYAAINNITIDPGIPLHLLEGVRYLLSVPRFKHQQAMDYGCRFNGERWYFDNPSLTQLADLASWKPMRALRPAVRSILNKHRWKQGNSP